MKSKQKQTPTEIIDNQRQAVVEKIIEDMKRDGLRWAEPYLPSLTPHNPVSGTVYQGGNRVHLGFIGFMRGYTDNRWATFNQIKDAGWHVKKGAKSALIEKWKQFAFYKENEDTGEKELAGRYPKLVGYWNVFNAEDIEGIPPENVAAAGNYLNDRDMIEHAGIGIAVGNAVPEIKALADIVLQHDCEHDAIAELVDKLLAM